MPTVEQFLGLPKVGKIRIHQPAGGGGGLPRPGIPRIHATPRPPQINYGAVAQVGRQPRPQRPNLFQMGPRPAPGLLQAPGMGAPLPQTRLPKLSKVEGAAIKAIKQSYNSNYKDPGRKANQLIFNPTPKMQIHINNMVGGNLAHKMAVQDAQQSPSWTQPVTQALQAGNRQFKQQMATDPQFRAQVRQNRLEAQKAETAGFGYLPLGPVSTYAQRLGTGIGQMATGFGPGVASLGEHAYKGLANLDYAGAHALHLPTAKDMPRYSSQTPYFENLGKQQAYSFKNMFTTDMIWKDPAQFWSNALVVASAGAGAAARAGRIAEIADAARAGEISRAEAVTQVRKALWRPPTKFRKINIGPDVGPKMTLYHGGPTELEGGELRVVKKEGGDFYGGGGLYATSHPDVAQVYANMSHEPHVHEVNVPRDMVAKVERKLNKAERKQLEPILGSLPKDTKVGDIFRDIQRSPSQGYQDLIRAPGGGRPRAGIEEVHQAFSRAGTHGIEYPPVTTEDDLANFHDVLGHDVNGPEAEKSYEAVRNSREFKLWNPELLKKLAEQEPAYLEPPTAKGQLGSLLQRRVLDPLTEKAVQNRLYGIRPKIRALGREFQIPDQMLGLLPEGKVGKLARRDTEMVQNIERGRAEVRIAREHGLPGPYPPKGVTPLNREQQLNEVINHLKAGGHHEEAIKEFQDQLTSGGHEVQFSYPIVHGTFGGVPELDKALDSVIEEHHGTVVETGGGMGSRDYSVQFPDREHARNFISDLTNRYPEMKDQFDLDHPQGHGFPVTREGVPKLGVTSTGAREAGGWLNSLDEPGATENIRDYLERNAPYDPAYQAALDKFRELDRGAKKPPIKGTLGRAAERLGERKVRVIGGKLEKPTMDTAPYDTTHIGVINPTTGRAYWGGDGVTGHHQLWDQVVRDFPNPKDQEKFVSVRANVNPRTGETVVVPTLEGEGWERLGYRFDKPTEPGKPGTIHRPPGFEERVNKVGKQSLERAYRVSEREKGINADKYLNDSERQQIADILEKHRSLSEDPYMVDEHLAHVHEHNSEHMVQLFSNEDPLFHGSNSVEGIPEIADLIKKHGGEGTHYTWDDTGGQLIQEHAGLPDELRPMRASRTGNVYFKNGEDARAFEEEFNNKISPKMDVHPLYHHINPDTEGDIPDTLGDWQSIFSPGASGHRANAAYARAVKADLDKMEQGIHPGELQRKAYAEGSALAHIRAWHTWYNGGAGADETVLAGHHPEDYVAIRRPPNMKDYEKTSAKAYTSERNIANQYHNMVVENPRIFMANPHDYTYIPKGTWQRMKFQAPETGPLGKAFNAVDAVNQAIRAGRFLHPGYVAWAVQNGILHLSQAGMFAFRNAMQHKNEFSKLTADDKAQFDGAVGAGHFGGGIARASAGSETSYRAGWTQAMASKWHEVDDKYFRRLSLIHELNREGYHNAEAWSKLMKDNPQRFRTIARQAQREAIDYSEMGPGERATLQKLFTAWGWIRGASTYTMRFPFQHPAQFAAALPIMRQGQKEVDQYYKGYNGMVPEWLKGYLPVGHGHLLETGVINPGETLGSFMAGIPGLTHGQTESLQSEESPAITALTELASGMTRYGQPLRGGQRVSQPLSDLLHRFEPYAALSSLMESKKGGGTFKQGPAAAAMSFGGVPFSTLRDPKETAALGMKDYEQALSRPDEIRFRTNYDISRLASEAAFLKKHGAGITSPHQLAAIRGDLEAKERMDLFQLKYANDRGANSFRSLPAINKYKAAIQFGVENKTITPQQAQAELASANSIKDDSILETMASALWSGYGIGEISGAWKSTLKALQPSTLTPGR